MKKYLIVIPSSGTGETRNPETRFYGCGGRTVATEREAYIDDDLSYFKTRLRELKKKNDFYKKAFIITKEVTNEK